MWLTVSTIKYDLLSIKNLKKNVTHLPPIFFCTPKRRTTPPPLPFSFVMANYYVNFDLAKCTNPTILNQFLLKHVYRKRTTLAIQSVGGKTRLG